MISHKVILANQSSIQLYYNYFIGLKVQWAY